MRNLYLLLLLLFGGIWNPLSGQSGPSILLQSGAISPPDNINQFLAEAIPHAELIGGYYYRLLQFKEKLSQSQQTLIKSSGVRIYAYIPHQAYLVAIPSRFDRSKLLDWGVRSVLKLASRHKIQLRLQNEDYPTWAVQGNMIDLVVRFRPEMASYRMQQILQQKAYKILRKFEGEKEIYVRCPIDQIDDIAALESVMFIEPVPEPGQPEDIPGRNLQRSNWLSSYAPMGRQYDGSGIDIMVRDDGEVGPHIDFQGRLEQSQLSGNFVGTHGDGVAGVMGSAGNLSPRAKGGASGSHLWIMDYDATFTDNTLLLHQSQGVMITNSSYSNGCNAGYTSVTQRVDRQTYQNPSLLHVFSAGNSNFSNCSYGAGNQWGNITGGHKAGKNVIATANLFADASIVVSSSRGPASDGRIKPDMSAHGQGELSTSPNHTYSAFGGTSASAPTGAGLLAQLYHAYRELNANAYPESGLIKAIVMNTAQDLGNPGPDFTYGWGLYHGLRAVKVLEDGRYLNSSLSQGDTMSHTINVPSGVQEVRVMLYWTDPEASIFSSRALVNDLNLRLRDGSGAIKFPLILDHTPIPITLDADAVPGVDSLNNVEQVRIQSPTAGSYQVEIIGKSVPTGPQNYFLVFEYIYDEILLTFPTGGEAMVPGEIEIIHWDALGDSEPFALEASFDSGNVWILIGNNIVAEARTYDWTVPNNIGGETMIRLSRGMHAPSTSSTFSICGLPNNITVDQVCPTYTRLSWASVAGATAYDVFVLGSRYMDSVATTTNTTIDIHGTNPTVGNWYSVRAVGLDGLRGRRANAVFQPAGFMNCNISNDINSQRISSPSKYRYNLCQDSLTIQFWLYNEGNQAESNIPVHYRFGPHIQVDETFNGSINAGDSVLYTFVQNLDLAFFNGFGGEYELVVWHDQFSDQNFWNDSLRKTILLMDQVISPIYREDFESFPLCGTANDCAATVCVLGNGWINVKNGIADDIDWRTHEGPTSSSGTGPTSDQYPGTFTGNYLFLESSFCTNKEAKLISPCVDLTNSVAPAMKFGYHMFGSYIGELHVDIFDGHNWQQDVIPPFLGPQGPDWLEADVDLAAFIGKIVQIRFRGFTDSGWQGDIALDNVFFFDLGLPPTLDFNADLLYSCPGETIIFEAQTSPGIVTYNWTFSPATVSFLNGTSAVSERPEVSFDVAGIYTVNLNAATIFASNTHTKMNYVLVNDIGANLPFNEDFEGASFPPSNWFVNNPDTSYTFQSVAAIGAGGTPSKVTFVNNALYGALGAEDFLQSAHIDLASIANPWLSFDVAYAPHSINHADSLRVDLSLDCGQTWTDIIYFKGGADLGTVGFNPIPWAPDSASHWRRDSVDLSPWIGNSINLRFVNINQFGNNLFIDNISLEATPTQPPSALFFTNRFQSCEDEFILMTDNSLAIGGTYFWDFGLDAVPATSTQSGPHQVNWTSGGTKTIILTVTNAIGSSNYSQQVQILPQPIADFSYAYVNNHILAFNNMSSNLSNQYWDFGDGGSSTLFSPTHAYLANGTYHVRLLTANGCGTDTLDQFVVISGITAPVALFSASSSILCEGESFVFDDQSQGVGISQYLWDFGPGGTPLTANTPGPHTVSYTGAGPRTVILSVTNGTGTSIETFALTVDPLPVANFSSNQTNLNTFLFANSSLHGTSYFWDYGDGNTSTNVAPTYSYLNNGIYPVSLIVNNNCSADTMLQSVIVSGIQAPQAEMIYSSQTVCIGDTITFLDQSQGIGIQAYQWNFGENAFPGSSSTPGPHKVLYQTSGTKLIVLSVTNGSGSSLDSQYVEIIPPVAPAIFDAAWQNGKTWNFTPDSLQAGDSYLWNFGNGQQSIQATPQHTYLLGGTYTVELIVHNACGSDTASSIVVDASVGFENEFADLKMTIAPNPAQEQFSLLVEGAAASLLGVKLWDPKGRIVRAAQHQHLGASSRLNMRVGNLPAGLYLLQISREETSIFKRVLVY